MSEAWTKAHQVREHFKLHYRKHFPICEVANAYGLNVAISHDVDDRWQVAMALGQHFRVDPKVFAAYVLAPLHLVEPTCVYGRVKTGETWLFGLLDKTRGYTTQELADMFGVPLQVMRLQLGKLV